MLIWKPEQQKFEQTLVMIKPHTEAYTHKNQEYFYKLIRRWIHQHPSLQIDSHFIKYFTKQEAEEHYSQLRFSPNYSKIIEYIISWQCHLILISGENAITQIDKFKDSLRKRYNCHPWLFDWIYNEKPHKNILHTPDSQKEAQAEVKRYFPDFYIGK